MNPRLRAAIQLGILILVVVLLFAFFPAAFRFVEAAAVSIRHLWWLILLAALGFWLIWVAGRSRGK